jgi:chemotaxis signal transduction protein
MSTPTPGSEDHRAPGLKPSQYFARIKRPAPLGEANVTRAVAVRFGYRAGSLGFLVGTGVLSEYLPRPNIFPIPNVHAAIRGYVNLQGALVAVWDLQMMLGDVSDDQLDAAADTSRDAVLVLGRGDQRVGVVVDGLPRALKKLERTTRPSQLPQSLQSYVQDAYFGEDALWLEFDQEAFFKAQVQSLSA